MDILWFDFYTLGQPGYKSEVNGIVSEQSDKYSVLDKISGPGVKYLAFWDLF